MDLFASPDEKVGSRPLNWVSQKEERNRNALYSRRNARRWTKSRHPLILRETRRAEFVTDMQEIRNVHNFFRKISRYENFKGPGVRGRMLNLKLQ
jgi:ribosomal protein S4